MPNAQVAIRPYIPLLARIYGPVAPMGYALVRAFTAAVLIPHGVQKLFYGGAASSVAGKAFTAWGLPEPLIWAYGIGALELFGGILLLLGLFTRPVALLFAIELLVFIFGVHIDKGWLWNKGGYQYPTFLFILMLAFVFRGGGHYSLDRVRSKAVAGELSMMDEQPNIDESRLAFPALVGLYRHLAPLGYLLTRIAFAVAVLQSGWEKLFNGGVYRIAVGNVTKAGFSNPLAWAWAVGTLEFFGALLLVFGLFTRPVAFALAIQMGVITFLIQFKNGYFWMNYGYEFSLLLMLVCLAFVVGGGGRFSIDRRIGREF